jgi:hypothetical protein
MSRCPADEFRMVSAFLFAWWIAAEVVMGWEMVWVPDADEARAALNGLLSQRECARRLNRSLAYVQGCIAAQALEQRDIGGRKYVLESSLNRHMQVLGLTTPEAREQARLLDEPRPDEQWKREGLIRRLEASDPVIQPVRAEREAVGDTSAGSGFGPNRPDFSSVLRQFDAKYGVGR